MRTITFTLVAITLLIHSEARGQTLLVRSEATGLTPRFEAGLQLGPSLGWLRGNKTLDATDPLLGPAAAVTLQYGCSKTIGVRVGLGYQRKGTTSEVTFTDINGSVIRDGEIHSALDYLLIPVMMRASFGNKAHLTVGVGPYAGFLMRSRQTSSGGLDFPAFDNTDDLEKWDMGISASLGGSLPLGDALAIQTEVRYDKGLTNVSALPVINDGSIRTNAVCLMLGCSYRFGKAA